jgi:hypothetical protein
LGKRILVPALTITAPLIVAWFTWLSTERSKLRWESYELERARYEALLNSVDGLFVGTRDRALAAEFVRQLRLCSLYCPDDVVRAANAFTDASPTRRLAAITHALLKIGSDSSRR